MWCRLVGVSGHVPCGYVRLVVVSGSSGMHYLSFGELLILNNEHFVVISRVCSRFHACTALVRSITLKTLNWFSDGHASYYDTNFRIWQPQGVAGITSGLYFVVKNNIKWKVVLKKFENNQGTSHNRTRQNATRCLLCEIGHCLRSRSEVFFFFCFA